MPSRALRLKRGRVFITRHDGHVDKQNALAGIKTKEHANTVYWNSLESINKMPSRALRRIREDFHFQREGVDKQNALAGIKTICDSPHKGIPVFCR